MKHLEDSDKLHELSKFVDDFFSTMSDDYSEVKEGFEEELDDFTDEVDEEMIREFIENLKHRDGSHSGMKWSLEDVQNVARQYDVKSKVESSGKQFVCVKFWAAMNYAYAVHFSVNRTINGYIDLALDEMCNKNICFDKLIKKIFEKM